MVEPAQSADSGLLKGLTSDEARSQLEKCGPNAMPDTSAHPVHMVIASVDWFWLERRQSGR
jgi:hypothetical protein